MPRQNVLCLHKSPLFDGELAVPQESCCRYFCLIARDGPVRFVEDDNLMSARRESNFLLCETLDSIAYHIETSIFLS